MMLFQKPSLMTRIAVGKAIGLVVGMIAALSIPWFVAEVSALTRIGLLLWYPTMGAVIGVFGVMSRHPVLDLPLPWWVRAPLVGAWMNLVLVCFAHELLAELLSGVFGADVSAFWFVFEGAVVGGIMGYFATRVGGEGVASLEQDLGADVSTNVSTNE